MTQLTIELSEQDYQALESEAQQRGESIEGIARKYLSIASLLSQKDQTTQPKQWPEGYFEKTAGCFADMPIPKLGTTQSTTRKKSVRGCLKKYAQPDLIVQEQDAWQAATGEKYEPR